MGAFTTASSQLREAQAAADSVNRSYAADIARQTDPSRNLFVPGIQQFAGAGSPGGVPVRPQSIGDRYTQVISNLPTSAAFQANQAARGFAAPMQAYAGTMTAVSEVSSLVGNAIINPPIRPPNPANRADIYRPVTPTVHSPYSLNVDPYRSSRGGSANFFLNNKFKGSSNSTSSNSASTSAGASTPSSSASDAAQIAAYNAQAAANLAERGKDTRSVSYDPASMRAAALQRRAASDAGRPDEQTLANNMKAERDAIIIPDIVSLKNASIEAAKALANGISDVKKGVESAQAASGIKPVPPPKPPKKAPKKPLPKPRGRR